MSMPSLAHGRTLRWALHSKHPNRPEDYSVVADSTGGREIKELGQLIRRSLPGEARIGDRGSSVLPWVTFAGSGRYTGHDERLGVSIMAWDAAGSRDAAGRPIIATRYFDIRFPGDGGAQPGYWELLAGVTDVTLPAESDLPVTVPSANLGRLTADIDEIGFEWVASLAALLLDQPVMIAAAPVPPLAERIRCLDAVAALLPYGFRADLVAGTWTPNLANHEIRLAFADRVKDQQHQVGWRVVPDFTPLAGPVPQYLQHLLDLRKRLGTRQVVDRLWRNTSPLPPGTDGVTTALRCLEQEDRPYSTVVRYHRGLAVPGEARAVLEVTDPDGIEPDVRSELLRRLAVEGTDPDLTLLGRLWSEETLPILVDQAAEAPVDQIMRYADLATRQGALPAFRLRLVEAIGGDLCPDRRGRAAEFLTTSPPSADEPQLRQALHRHEALCVELVTAAVENGPERFEPWLRWLTAAESIPQWLQPFAVAVRDGQPLQPGNAIALAGWGPRLIVAVLTVARARRTVAVVLPGLWPELVRAVDQDRDRRTVAALLAELPTQPARTQGLIDLLLATWGEAPHPGGDVADPDAYAVTVRDQLLSWLPTQRRRAIAGHLIRCLADLPRQPDPADLPRQPGPADLPRQPDGLTLAIALAERLLPDPVYEDIDHGLRPALEAAPARLRALPTALRRRLLSISPLLQSRGLLDRLADAVDAGVDEDEIVGLWAEGVQLGCRTDDVLRAIRAWPEATDPASMYSTIERLLHRLIEVGHRDIIPTVQGAHQGLLSGALGAEMATEYRTYLEAVGGPLRLHAAAVSRALAGGRAASLTKILRRQRRQR